MVQKFLQISTYCFVVAFNFSQPTAASDLVEDEVIESCLTGCQSRKERLHEESYTRVMARSSRTPGTPEDLPLISREGRPNPRSPYKKIGVCDRLILWTYANGLIGSGMVFLPFHAATSLRLLSGSDDDGIVCGKVQELGFKIFSPFIKTCEYNMFPPQW
jgi:hypothetical protein